MAVVVQDRDCQLLREIAYPMRVVDREQASVAVGFHSVTRANTRLHALVNAGLLNRCFVGTTNGGKKALYLLAPKGAALVGISSAVRRKRDAVLVGDAFINHQLRVNALYLGFKFGLSPSGARFQRWRMFTQPLSSSSPIIPDGYVEMERSPEPLCMFVEVDLSTERLDIWRKKIEAYLRLAVNNDFSKLSGHSRFRVLVVANSFRRMRSISEVISSYTDKIFWLAAFDGIERDGIWVAPWFRPASPDPLPLLGGSS